MFWVHRYVYLTGFYINPTDVHFEYTIRRATERATENAWPIFLNHIKVNIYTSYAGELFSFSLANALSQRSPTFLATGTSFVEDNFSKDRGWVGDGFGMIQVHYIY